MRGRDAKYWWPLSILQLGNARQYISRAFGVGSPRTWTRLPSSRCSGVTSSRRFPQEDEAGTGIEPVNSGFADRGLTTWLPRRILLPEPIRWLSTVSTLFLVANFRELRACQTGICASSRTTETGRTSTIGMATKSMARESGSLLHDTPRNLQKLILTPPVTAFES
jgi:hypothetical protein